MHIMYTIRIEIIIIIKQWITVLTFNKIYNIHILHITHAHTYHTSPHIILYYIPTAISLYYFQISGYAS